MLYEGLWPQVLKPEDHQHEDGEDAEACANCRLDEEAERMSAFETACWNWYQENAGGFSMESGAAGLELYRTARALTAGARRLFKRAVDMIYQTSERVALERAKAARKEE